jgi:FixJ family two-component response regulator
MSRILSDIPFIAVVDDDPMVGEATAELIESFGLVAHIFSSAQAYLKSNCVRRAACVVADMQMPGMDGLQLQQRLARSGHPVPIIFVTAFPDERVRERAMKAGAVNYLSKPFEPRDLIGCIRSAIGHALDEPNT